MIKVLIDNKTYFKYILLEIVCWIGMAAIGSLICLGVAKLVGDPQFGFLFAFIIPFPLIWAKDKIVNAYITALALSLIPGGKRNPISNSDDFRIAVMENPRTDYDLYIYEDVTAYLDVFQAIRDKNIRLVILERGDHING